MAYFTGVFGKDIKGREFSLENNTCIYRDDNLILFSGGNEKRMYTEAYNDSAYIFTGMAIRNGKIDNKHRYIQKTDEPDYGHYACAEYSNRKLILFCDPTGTRTIYYLLKNGVLCFSTRLDAIASISSVNKIDWQTIGSLFANGSSMDNTAELSGVKKLMPGESLLCTADKIILHTAGRKSVRSGISLENAILNTLNIDKSIDLALSGGVDSRILLAVLMKNRMQFNTHTHGTERDTDVIVANSMARDLKIKHRIFQDTSSESIMGHIRNFLVYNPVNPGLFRARLFSSFSREYGDDDCIIDGSYGEFYRKTRYLTWAHAFHRGIRDPGIIRRIYSRSIPDLFNPEIRKTMENGVLEHIENAQQEFSRQEYFKSIVDFLFFNYGNANNWSREQARMDELAYAYMPFAQMPVVHSSLYPGAVLSARSINRIYPPLRKYPFAKSGHTIPFNDRRKWRRKFSNRKHRTVNDDICAMLNDPEIREFLNSDPVPEEFNRQRIKRMTDSYYKGNRLHSSSLNTYLSLRLVPYLFK